MRLDQIYEARADINPRVKPVKQGKTPTYDSDLPKQFTVSEEDVELPKAAMDHIKKLVRKGAGKVEQQWANALELVYRAFLVAKVPRPTPDKPKLWKQFEELLGVGVKELAKYKGKDGEWRLSTVKENDEELVFECTTIDGKHITTDLVTDISPCIIAEHYINNTVDSNTDYRVKFTSQGLIIEYIRNNIVVPYKHVIELIE